jgi:hypothetical protein
MERKEGLTSLHLACLLNEVSMWDIGCVVASVAFFAIAIAYTAGCERLGSKAGKPWS